MSIQAVAEQSVPCLSPGVGIAIYGNSELFLDHTTIRHTRQVREMQLRRHLCLMRSANLRTLSVDTQQAQGYW